MRLTRPVLLLSIAIWSSSHGAWAMTVEAKAGQVLALAFRGTAMDEATVVRINDIKPGGVILYRWNVSAPSQVRGLISDLKERCALDDPVMVALDQEGGLVARIRTEDSDFPGLMALGATGDAHLARRQGYVMGIQMRSLGIDVDYAPVVDVNSNPKNPVIGVRSFGDDVDMVSSMGSAVIEGFAQAGLGCSAKHFPGHGDVDMDSHLDLPVLDRPINCLRRLELAPFVAAVKAGVPAVMTAHVVIPDLTGELPSTLSPAAVSLLRDELGFDGVILSDSMGMKAISDRWGVAEASVMALKAGVDMILLGADPAFPPERQGEVHDRIVQAVLSGELKESRLDEAVSRIEKWKRDMGLYGEEGRPGWLDGSDLIEEIANRSITLMRSDGSLPLGSGSVALVWPEVSMAKGESLAGLLRDSGVDVSLFALKDAEECRLRGKLAHFDLVLVGAYDLQRDGEMASFVSSLGKRSVLLSMKTPYDIMTCPDIGTAVACYGDRPATLRALARILMGARPLGRLPVTIPGFYDQGWGLERF